MEINLDEGSCLVSEREEGKREIVIMANYVWSHSHYQRDKEKKQRRGILLIQKYRGGQN